MKRDERLLRSVQETLCLDKQTLAQELHPDFIRYFGHLLHDSNAIKRYVEEIDYLIQRGGLARACVGSGGRFRIDGSLPEDAWCRDGHLPGHLGNEGDDRQKTRSALGSRPLRFSSWRRTHAPIAPCVNPESGIVQERLVDPLGLARDLEQLGYRARLVPPLQWDPKAWLRDGGSWKGFWAGAAVRMIWPIRALRPMLLERMDHFIVAGLKP